MRAGDTVRIGDALVEERGPAKRKIVSLCSGVVKEIRRGLKRQPLSVIVEKGSAEEKKLSPIDVASATKEEVLERIGELGLFSKITQRPFDIPANPAFLPQAIFIKAVDRAPGALGALGFEALVEKNAEAFKPRARSAAENSARICAPRQ